MYIVRSAVAQTGPGSIYLRDYKDRDWPPPPPLDRRLIKNINKISRRNFSNNLGRPGPRYLVVTHLHCSLYITLAALCSDCTVSSVVIWVVSLNISVSYQFDGQDGFTVLSPVWTFKTVKRREQLIWDHSFIILFQAGGNYRRAVLWNLKCKIFFINIFVWSETRPQWHPEKQTDLVAACSVSCPEMSSSLW